MQMPRYQMYGLVVETDRPLPEHAALATPSPASPDVRVHLAEEAALVDWPMPPKAEGGRRIFTSDRPEYVNNPNVQIDYFESAGLYRFLYGDGIVFLINTDSRGNPRREFPTSELCPLPSGFRVWGSWPKDMTLEDAVVYLLGPVLGFILRLRGLTALHASAAVFGGRAVVFVGPGGSGKSTLAAALARAGYPILSDDVSALSETSGVFRVIPGYPQLRLWRDSVRLLYGADDALPKLVPASDWWDKRYLDLDQAGLRFQDQPAPLGGVYLLEPPDQSVLGARIGPVPPLEALPRLIPNTYANYALNREMRAAEFQTLGRLLRQVTVKELTLGTGALENVGKHIEGDLR